MKLKKEVKDGKTTWSPDTGKIKPLRRIVLNEIYTSTPHVVKFQDSNFKIGLLDDVIINKWLKKHVYPIIIAEQKAQPNQPAEAIYSWKLGYPYEGAIGGGVTYSFTPTSVGTVLIVSYGDKYELNLTDYDAW